MVDDQQLPEALEPVGEHDPAVVDGAYGIARGRVDHHTAPPRTATRPLAAVTGAQFAAGRPGKRIALRVERLLLERRPRNIAQYVPEFGQQFLQPFPARLQALELVPFLRDRRLQLFHHLTPFAPGLFQRGPLFLQPRAGPGQLFPGGTRILRHAGDFRHQGARLVDRAEPRAIEVAVITERPRKCARAVLAQQQPQCRLAAEPVCRPQLRRQRIAVAFQGLHELPPFGAELLEPPPGPVDSGIEVLDPVGDRADPLFEFRQGRARLIALFALLAQIVLDRIDPFPQFLEPCPGLGFVRGDTGHGQRQCQGDEREQGRT